MLSIPSDRIRDPGILQIGLSVGLGILCKGDGSRSSDDTQLRGVPLHQHIYAYIAAFRHPGHWVLYNDQVRGCYFFLSIQDDIEFCRLDLDVIL